MIHIVPKPYQVVLWRAENRLSQDPALRMDFQTLDEAMAALGDHQASGFYRVGVLLEWRKQSGIWNLIARYP